MTKSQLRSLWILLGLLLSVAAIFLLFPFSSDSTAVYLTLTWAWLVILLLWFGNLFLSTRLDGWLSWKQYVGIRFGVQIVLSTIYTLLCLNSTFFLFRHLFTSMPPTSAQIIVMNVYGVTLSLPIFSIYFGVHFLKAWRKSELESERLQKENARSQMMALKNHLDPHFLFNNLNILSSLMDTDTELSQRYLEKFADVYRIILQTEFTDLILVEEELRLIDSYIFLLGIRFGKSISFELDIEEVDRYKAIPPLAIQMLIENAIKHNAFFEDRPLHISIRSCGEDCLQIQNPLQPKFNACEDGNGSGLENIQNRYQYYTDRGLQITHTDQIFSVQIPLLEIESL